jgi:hypothetical protein
MEGERGEAVDMGVSGGETRGIYNPREPREGGAGGSSRERVYGNNHMRLLRGVAEVQSGYGSVCNSVGRI